MQVIQRVGYYMGGFAVGLILLAFFLKGSGTEIPSCDYMPNARVLKTIRNRGYETDERFQKLLAEKGVDTVQLNQLFKEGDVDFDKSDTNTEPCGLYYISSPASNKTSLHVEVSICRDEDFVTVNNITKD